MSAGSDLYMDDSRMSGLSRQLRSLADGAALRMQLPFVDPAHYLVALADWPNSGMPSVGKLLIDEGGLQPRHSFDSLASFYAHARVDGTPVIMLYTVYGKKMYQLAAERLQDQPLKSVSVFDLTIAALRSGSVSRAITSRTSCAVWAWRNGCPSGCINSMTSPATWFSTGFPQDAPSRATRPNHPPNSSTTRSDER